MDLINNFLSTQLSKVSRSHSKITVSKRVKRSKLVGPGGACITSDDSHAILEAEANEKLQKKSMQRE